MPDTRMDGSSRVPARPHGVAARLWHSAWPLLALANLFWAGNIVMGRGIAGQVPPITLAYWRWTGAFLIALGFAWPHIKRDYPAMLRQWPLMLLLAATGIASYNTLSYIGLTATTALNVVLLQSVSPLVIIVWAFALFGDRPSWRQSMGVMVSLAGVAAIASRGSVSALADLTVNRGDAFVLLAIAIYGIYCAIVRKRPAAHPLGFLVVLMGLGSCMILPFYLWEAAHAAPIQASAGSFLALAYMAVFPSFVAYLFFNRAMDLVGAGPAGQSMHLMPVFGSVLAVLFLGESFQAYHAAGIILIAAGIVLATLKR